MQVTITPHSLCGTVTPPPSKSQAHRVIIAAALAEGCSVISGVQPSQDITATLSCMTALGAEIAWQEDTLTIHGIGIARPAKTPELCCGESGSTLRFLIPIALVLAEGGRFTGRGRLMQRPQEPYFAIFREKGIAFSTEHDTLNIRGRLTPGLYRLPGNVSSQFVTGLMYALPLLSGDSHIHLTTDLESSGYIQMTIDALQQFGVTVVPEEGGWLIPGRQRYHAQNVSVEADYSQAAFFYAAQGMGNPVTVSGMHTHSHQGDRIILDYENRLNHAGPVTLDVRECPDLVPALAARAALRPGDSTHIVNAGRLRIKESDRLASVTAVLHALGAQITEEPEGLLILGRDRLSGGVTVDSWNDHRIAMMAAIAASRCDDPVTITGAECVRKSYPTFWEEYARLGGKLEVTP